MMLIVPGRLGTSSPELGVPTTFADISEFDVVCEVEEKEAGYKNMISDFSDTDGDIVQVYDLKDAPCTLYYDLEKNHLMLKM